MNQSATKKTSKMVIVLNKIKTYFSKPQNIILLLFGIVLTFTTVAPIVAIVEDTFKIHPGTIDAHLTGKAGGYSVANYVDLFTSKLARTNLWTPLLNTVLLAVFTCLISILFGGLFAFLITRTNLKCKKYLSNNRYKFQLKYYFPLHHAPVDTGCGMAECVQQQCSHRNLQRTAGISF